MLTIHIERTVDNRRPEGRIAFLEAQNEVLRERIAFLEQQLGAREVSTFDIEGRVTESSVLTDRERM